MVYDFDRFRALGEYRIKARVNVAGIVYRYLAAEGFGMNAPVVRFARVGHDVAGIHHGDIGGSIGENTVQIRIDVGVIVDQNRACLRFGVDTICRRAVVEADQRAVRFDADRAKAARPDRVQFSFDSAV